MPNVLRWLSASLNRKQIDYFTAAGTGDWVQGDTITLTINNVGFIITVGTLVTDAQVATTVYQALTGTTLTDTAASCTIAVADGGASLIPQFSEFTATNPSSGLVYLTANGTGALAGKPFTITSSVSVSGDETFNKTSSVTPTSQYHASEPDNWDGTNTPADGDTLIFDSGSNDVRWGLNTYQSSSTAQPATVTVYKSYTGNIGLAQTNIDNSSKPYPEYRTRYFTFDDNSATTTFNLEVGEGIGSGRLMFDSGAGQAVVNVFGKGSRLVTGVPCVLWKGSNAANIVRNLAGDIGIAFFGGETATVATLVTGDGPSSQTSTVCGTGVTLTTVTCNGGTLETNSAITTLNVTNGTAVHKAGTITTLNQYDGFVYVNGAVTVTTLNLYGGTFDCRKGNASITITNTVQMYKGSKFYDPQGRCGNVVFKLNGCSFDEVTIILPENKIFTPS